MFCSLEPRTEVSMTPGPDNDDKGLSNFSASNKQLLDNIIYIPDLTRVLSVDTLLFSSCKRAHIILYSFGIFFYLLSKEDENRIFLDNLGIPVYYNCRSILIYDHISGINLSGCPNSPSDPTRSLGFSLYH